MNDSRFLSTSEAAAALDGEAPEPFVVGRRLELIMDTGRLVRGEVLMAGVVAAQIGIPRVLLIAYGQIMRWAEPLVGSDNGNWNPAHPDYDAQIARSSGRWHDWPRL